MCACLVTVCCREMRARSDYGGFEFVPRPSDKYYRELPKKVRARGFTCMAPCLSSAHPAARKKQR